MSPDQRAVRITIPVPTRAAPAVARALQRRASVAASVSSWRRSRGFPWSAPTWPGSVARPPVESSLGADYDTDWARSPAARVGRALLVDGVVGPTVRWVASPTITGHDRLIGVDGPVIFAANHASHLDVLLILTSLPERFRHRTAVAAAADYFFDRRVKAAVSALALAAIPMDRNAVGRKSLHQAEALLEDGWNLVIFPEGGRTPDGWAREFKAGAAFLAARAGVPVVPVHIEGSRRVWRKGGHVHRSTTNVTFGPPLRSGDSLKEARALAEDTERAVAELADEQASDWWTARRRAAAGTTPALTGPAAGAWRRSWELGEGKRRQIGIRWPA